MSPARTDVRFRRRSGRLAIARQNEHFESRALSANASKHPRSGLAVYAGIRSRRTRREIRIYSRLPKSLNATALIVCRLPRKLMSRMSLEIYRKLARVEPIHNGARWFVPFAGWTRSKRNRCSICALVSSDKTKSTLAASNLYFRWTLSGFAVLTQHPASDGSVDVQT